MAPPYPAGSKDTTDLDQQQKDNMQKDNMKDLRKRLFNIVDEKEKPRGKKHEEHDAEAEGL